jgi:hypothetical protein
MRTSCQSMTASPREHDHTGARRIFAGISRSAGSMHALRQAAGLARQHDAVLVPLLPECRPAAT